MKCEMVYCQHCNNPLTIETAFLPSKKMVEARYCESCGVLWEYEVEGLKEMHE